MTAKPTASASPQKRTERKKANVVKIQRKWAFLTGILRVSTAHSGLVAGSSPAGPTSAISRLSGVIHRPLSRRTRNTRLALTKQSTERTRQADEQADERRRQAAASTDVKVKQAELRALFVVEHSARILKNFASAQP
jgi:hypothetical protein